MVKRLPSSAGQVNGASEGHDEYCGVGPDHRMTFDVKDVVVLNVDNVSMDKTKSRNGTYILRYSRTCANIQPQGASVGFKTDSDISGHLQARERDLQRWVPSADTDVDLSLEDTGAGWDQFETNERLFGATSNYDEDLYTTKIDRNDPRYKDRAAKAEKLAREIESGTALNAHVLEERGNAAPDDSGLDEEEKYSGVKRDFPSLASGQPNKYTPPARRAPVGQTTVSGALVDPAIISSQVARPEATVNRAPQPQAGDAKEQQVNANAAKQEERQPAATALAAEQSTATPTATRPAETTVNTEATKKAPSTLQQTPSDMAARKPGRTGPNTVEHDLLDSFKQFSANEKMKLQERQRHAARHDKNVKLNDLKKFAMNFNYSAPIPEDLIPILAKDPSKQQEIKQKSQKAAEERKTSVSTTTETKTATSTADVKTQPRASGPSIPAPINQRGRPGQGPFPQAPRGDRNAQNIPGMPPRNGPGMLSQRLAITQQQHKAGAGMPNMPLPIQDMRIPPSGPAAPSSGSHTPSSSISTRFNVKALEFRPNPAANTFTPGGNSSNASSPRKEAVPPRPEPRRAPTSSFFGGQKPLPPSEKPSLSDQFNPIKRMKKEVQADNKTKEYSANGGIPQAYRTPPTWDVPEHNREKNFTDLFERAPITVQPNSAPQAALNNVHPPHQHQLPTHLQQGSQGMPQVHTPQHTPRHPPVQPHHPGAPHFDGHNMQFSASQSSVHPSPRAGMPHFIQYGQVPQQMQNFQQGGMPATYTMSPAMRAVPVGPQPGFVQAPVMGGQFPGPQMAQMPQMPQMPQMQQMMQSPAPGQAYPYQPGPMPAPMGANGFPSPRPGPAPMMVHQGSQQGHAPQQFMPMPNGGYPGLFHQMQPGSSKFVSTHQLYSPNLRPVTPMRGPYPQPHPVQFAPSPHQHHQYPQPHRGTPSGPYSQPMMAQHSLPPQMPPPAGPGPHVPEAGEKAE